MIRLISVLTMILVTSCILTACGDTDNADGNELVPPTDSPMKRASYGIGSGWYSFSLGTFRLTPFEDTWRYETADSTATLKVLDYYHPESGRSGYLTFSIQPEGENVREVFVDAKVQEGIVCLTLPDFAQVSCSDERVDLTLRTDGRPSPSAGFAAPSPGIYLRRDAETTLTRIRPDGEELDEPTYRGEGGFVDPMSQLLTSASEDEDLVAIQLNANMRLAQVRALHYADAAAEAELEARCTPVNVSPETTAPFEGATSSTLVFDVPDDEFVLLNYCSSEGVKVVGNLSFADFDKALWPSNRDFDALAAIRDGKILLLPAPDHAVEIRAAAWDSEEGTRLPAEIWNDSF